MADKSAGPLVISLVVMMVVQKAVRLAALSGWKSAAELADWRVEKLGAMSADSMEKMKAGQKVVEWAASTVVK